MLQTRSFISLVEFDCLELERGPFLVRRFFIPFFAM